MKASCFSLILLCVAVWSQAAEARIVDRIAAVVNHEVITERDVRRAAAPALAAAAQIDDLAKRAQQERLAMQQTVEEMVGQALVLQEAKKLKLDADETEVTSWFENLKRQYGWSDAELERAIESQGSSLAQYRDDIRRRLITQRVVQAKLGSTVRVTDRDVEEVFERESGANDQVPEITARHILLLIPEGADEATVQAKRKLAIELLARLRAGEEFASLARAHSEGPSAPAGGNLGSFRTGSLDPVFEKAAMAAEVGEVVGPVRTRLGLHLIQVTRRRTTEGKPAAKLKQEIRSRLRQQGLERELKLWVEELKRSAFIDLRYK